MEPKVVGCPVFLQNEDILFFGDHSSSSMFDLDKICNQRHCSGYYVVFGFAVGNCFCLFCEVAHMGI
jgi:hypothetical protein